MASSDKRRDEDRAKREADAEAELAAMAAATKKMRTDPPMSRASDNKQFHCELCNKQYASATEIETHLSSYDHHHKKVRAAFSFAR